MSIGHCGQRVGVSQAKKRQDKTDTKDPETGKFTSGGNITTTGDTGKVRDIIGARVGVSGSSIDKAATLAWLNHEKAEAKKRQEATQAKPGEGKVGGGNITTTGDTGKTRDIIGARVGVSGSSIDKAAEEIKSVWETFPTRETTKAEPVTSSASVHCSVDRWIASKPPRSHQSRFVIDG